MKKCKQCNLHDVKRSEICRSCNQKNWRKNNPLKYAYNNLKGHAKARGKEFTITFEDFKEFAIKVDYIPNKGVKSHSYHIDRKDETKGYIKGNLQILTNAENTRKYKAWRNANENEFNASFGVFIEKSDSDQYKDCPF